MPTVACPPEREQAAPAPGAPDASAQPSADGGVLLLARAWAALGGAAVLGRGLRWQGRAGGLLLFALIALPLLSARSVRAVATRCATAADPLWASLAWAPVVTQRRLARFVGSPRHDWWAVHAAWTAALAAQPALAPGAAGVLVVDSTTVEKRYGPRLAGRRPVYDACQQRLVDGYELVSACVVGAETPWALGLMPHAKAPTAPEREALKRRRRPAAPGEWPSKLDLALRWVEQAVAAGVAAATVVADSAFAVQWWLRAVAARDRHWLVATRQDRRLRHGATIQAASAWAGQLALTCVERRPAGGGVWGGRLPDATLLDRHARRRGLACQFAYFERRTRQGRVTQRWYLVTSQLTWEPAEIWRHWQQRWAIEQLHRDSKQWLALAAFHGRAWADIVAWVTATRLRASLLSVVRASDPAWAAFSTEALTTHLRQAACLVAAAGDAPGAASRPPTLPATPLWPSSALALPPAVDGPGHRLAA